MLTVEIANDGTGNSSIANYDYRVSINYRMIDSGRVVQFVRSLGWAELLRQVADDATWRERNREKSRE